MSYDEKIDRKMYTVVQSWDNIEKKNMFGGTCYMLNGNMFCGVHKEYMILRLGQDNADTALRQAYVRPFDITGKAMKGWVMVNPEGFIHNGELREWIDMAKTFADTLPPK